MTLRTTLGRRHAIRHGRRQTLRAALATAWLIAWALAGVAAAAQDVEGSSEDSPRLRISQYAHEVWTSARGLPQNSVSDIIQTRDGYLWVATQRGAARFDGARFHTWTREDGLPSDEISVLLEASDGAVWLGTSGGGVARIFEGEVTTIGADDGLRSNLVRSIYEDRDGVIWIGTIDGGLHRYDGEITARYGTKEGLAGNVVLAIEETADGDLWVGTEGGLSRIREGRITNYTRAEGLSGDLVWAIHRDPNGRLWIGTSGGLTRLENDGFVHYGTADGLCGEDVSALASDRDSGLWIGTLGGGVCRLAHGTFDAFRSADGLTNDRVRAIHVDHEENVWVGTERGGLDQFRIAKFTHVGRAEGLSHDVALSVLEVAPGVTAVGTEGGGLSLIREEGVSHITTADGLPADDVYALEKDSLGRIWLGMYSGGVCRLASAAARGPERCFSVADGLPSESVYALHAGADGRIWVGTLAGLVAIDGNRVVTPAFKRAFVDVPVLGVREDRRGDLWIATYGSGLYRVRDEQVRRFSAADGLASDIPLTLHEDRSGVLWVGTQGGGLCRVGGGAAGDRARSEAGDRAESEAGDRAGSEAGDRAESGRASADPIACSRAEGLPTDVLQILEDDDGSFWLGSMKGIYRVRIADVAAALDGRADHVPAVRFARADGLRIDEMNGGTQPSAWRSSDGRLWFTTSEGVAVIDPTEIRTNDFAPPVIIDCVHINGEHITAAAAMDVEPGTRDLVFYYTAPSFTAPDRVRFQYKLEGYDEDWVDAGARREAYYTNLPPGSYRFVVKAANNDGVWNEQGAAMSLRLQPHFYQTDWFMMLMVLLACGIGVLLYRLRIRKLRAHERELARQVDARTRELRMEKDRLEEAKGVIEGQAAELRDLNDHLEAKVRQQFDLLLEERRRYESNLIEAKERAEASDRLKTAILQNLNHEFRTPLTAILGFAEIIAAEGTDDVKVFSTEIRSGGRRLLRTLDALLEFSRLESDDAGSRVEQVDLALSAAAVLRDFERSATRKGLTLRTDALSPAQALVDASAVKEVIHNLIDNAVKFTDEGEVVVSSGLENERAFVCVRDTGPGIGPVFVGKMYDAFTQESDGMNRSYEGVGLGLTIVKRLVDQMGGEIEVETRKGKGSAFTVRFAGVGVEV